MQHPCPLAEPALSSCAAPKGAASAGRRSQRSATLARHGATATRSFLKTDQSSQTLPGQTRQLCCHLDATGMLVPSPFSTLGKADLIPHGRSPGRSRSPSFSTSIKLQVLSLGGHIQPHFPWVSLKFPSPAQFCHVFKCFVIFCCQLGGALGFVVIQKEGTTLRAFFLFPGKGLSAHKMMRFQGK